MSYKVTAIVRNNVVENVLIADASTYPAEEGIIFLDVDPNDVPAIGSSYDPETGIFTRPIFPILVPISVSPRQVRLLLLQQGLLDQVEAIIRQSDRPTQITWDYAIEFHRDDPLLNALAQQLNLTSEEVDQFFIAASQL